jgi:hypothetical protein
LGMVVVVGGGADCFVGPFSDHLIGVIINA